MSYDGDQLQPAARRESAATHQRSNSTEGVPYKRWGPFTSPIPLHRLQRQHLSTSLSSSTFPVKKLDYRSEGSPSSPPIQPHPHRETPASLHECQGRELNEQVDDATYLTIGSKRKHSEVSVEHTTVVDSDVSATHSHFSSLAPPSSHLYGDMEGSRREMLGSATSPEYQLTSSIKTGSFPQRQSMVTQQHDELEDEDDPEEGLEPDAAARAFDEGVLTASQRKSCDRCFKMKTKVRPRHGDNSIRLMSSWLLSVSLSTSALEPRQVHARTGLVTAVFDEALLRTALPRGQTFPTLASASPSVLDASRLCEDF